MAEETALNRPAQSQMPPETPGKRSFSVTLRALLGFSRVLQASFALAQAGLAAVLALRGFPQWDVFFMGTIACLSGSYALTAFNDAMDIEIDSKRFAHLRSYQGFDLSSVFIRHPLALGVISHRVAYAWIGGLSLLSMVFSYLIRPQVVLLFPVIAFLVYAYSKLTTITPYKFLVISAVVVLGSLAGWLAVADPQWPLMGLVALWMAAWEVGARNIPNDFADLEEDRLLDLKTIPVVYGAVKAAKASLAALLITFAASLAIVFYGEFGLDYLLLTLLVGTALLLLPGWRLYRDPRPEVAMYVFNRSCTYPGVMLAGLLASIYLF